MNGYTVGGLFDGCGLLAYGLHLAGWEHRWLCEVDPWRRELLALRFPGVRVYDDVRAVDARAERPLLIAGGFPCKGASTAGQRNGFEHPETVLWREMARAIGDLRPRYVLVENVANLLAVKRGAVWGEVLGDLAALGFDVAWDCIPAAAFGAPHLRDRVIAIATNADEGGGGARPLEPARFPGAGQPGAGGGAAATPDAVGERVWEQPVAERRGGGAAVAGSADPASTDAGGEGERGDGRGEPGARKRPDAGAADPSLADPEGDGVEWGDFEPAIRRWEATFGPAPEPLVRRVDDGRTLRVERSRLSALGDGVQVQLGRLAGEYIRSLERERLAA